MDQNVEKIRITGSSTQSTSIHSHETLRISASTKADTDASFDESPKLRVKLLDVQEDVCVSRNMRARARIPSYHEFQRNSCMVGTKGSCSQRLSAADLIMQGSSQGTVRKSCFGEEENVDLKQSRCSKILRKCLPAGRGRKVKPWYRVCSEKIIDQRWFTALTTFLTIYALTGSDIRIYATHQPADDVFNYIVMGCILVFSVELVLSCLGRDDYFMGFFFVLDFVSTLTLFLDLTFVNDVLFSSGSADQARSGRTARIGAKAGRVVRVLRLIRIVKLYKAWLETRGRSKPKRASRVESVDDEFDAFDEEEEPSSSDLKESDVGKKLTAKTTRKTIILVLSMLMVLPLLSQDESTRAQSSGFYAADDVQMAFTRLLQSNGSEFLRQTYEESVLKYLYYHNWYNGNHYDCPTTTGSCSNWFFNHVFWVGISSKDESKIRAVKDLVQLGGGAVQEWNAACSEQKNQYNFGTLPPQVLESLSSPWTASFQSYGYHYLGVSLLSKEVDGLIGYLVETPTSLRSVEFAEYFSTLITEAEYDDLHFTFFFDLRPIVHQEAVINVLMTIFICCVLCVGSLSFSSDANNLVLRPVETMVNKVEAIRSNPLLAMKMADDDFKREEMKRLKVIRERAERTDFQRLLDQRKRCFVKKDKEIMETAILEKTIIKLGSLLAIGFGEAGTSIVTQTMKGSSANVNVMSTGTTVECIIGSARIGDFSIANAVLQGKVVTFVNRIAEIVHGVVDEHHGATNKNNGDTFLTVWRAHGLPSKEVTKLAEMSVVAFTKVLGAVHRSPVLAAYREHPGLQQRLGSTCRVNITFGLHYGWVVEGAIGTEFKIDASYVSSNISIASRLEKATTIYGMPIMVSQTVVELCRFEMVEKMRLIDKVQLEGSKNPMELYCVDVCYEDLRVDEPMGLSFIWSTRRRFQAREQLEKDKERIWRDDVDMFKEFEDCRDIAIMCQHYTDEFRFYFDMGYQNYSQGEWQAARQYFSKTKDMLQRRDGPSWALLRFMESPTHGQPFVSPEGWQGVHDIGDFEALSAFQPRRTTAGNFNNLRF